MDRISFGISGCSVAQKRYRTAFISSPNCNITSLADDDTRLMRRWSRELGISPETFPSLTSLLASVHRPEAILIDITIINRYASILAATACCQAVLCAPLAASTLEEIDELLDITARNKVLLYPALFRRFDPAFLQISELLSTNIIGSLRQVRCDWSFPASQQMSLEIGADITDTSWSALLSYAGCHAVDVCRMWLGEALTVSADMSVGGGQLVVAGVNKRPINSPELATLLIAHENGQSSCHFSRSRSIRSSERYILTGTEASLELILSADTGDIDSEQPSILLKRPGQRVVEISAEQVMNPSLSRHQNRAAIYFDSAADSLLNKTQPTVTGIDARAALEIVHAAYLSAKEGRKVPLPLRRSPT